MWNHVCGDTDCHPLDIEHGKGKYLTFTPRHWAQMTGNMVARNIADLYATPPVRGDREMLERCAKLARQFELDMSGSQLDDRDIENIQHGVSVASNAIADTILSIPVQPGAGERGWPRVFNVKRAENNTWHADISFARCPTDDELRALEASLRDDPDPPKPSVLQEVTDQKYMRPGLDFARGKAVEELGELQAALGKSLRWGWTSVNPELPSAKQIPNVEWVRAEMQDVRGAINNLERELDKEF